MEAPHHIDELQSLRGVAALIVAVSHMSSIYVLPGAARIAIDSVCNAHASIVLFFVLSGYVLTGSLRRRGLSWPSVKAFYIARLFRLYPALWAVSAISALFLLLYPHVIIHPPSTFWFWLYLRPFPSGTQLVLAALAIDKSLIMPVWTVFIELIGSLLMPVIVIVALTRIRLWHAMLLAMGVASYTLAHAPHRLNSLAYLLDFALGAWLALREWKFVVDHSLAKLFAAASCLIFFRFIWFSILKGHAMPLYGYDDPVPMMVESIAAFYLVGLVASEPGRVQLLRSSWAVGLGNVSYSLYLIHFPVAILVAKVLSRRFSDQTSSATATAVTMTLGLSLSLGLAALLYRLIERPSIVLGKRVSKWLVVGRVTASV